MSCLFCAIAEKKIPSTIVYEDDRIVAFADIHPVAPTHLLVIPRQHIGGVQDLGPTDAPLVGALLVAAAEVARRAGLEAAGYRCVINNGEAAGQSVGHLHMHVIGGRTFSWPPG